MIEHDDTLERKSKTQRKREMLDLQILGEKLVKLKREQLAKIPLDEQLRDAIFAAQAIKSRGAHKRQLQYIGRLMRERDPVPIQTALAVFHR